MVAAKETSLRSILEGTKQYQVPLYQRTYAWTKPQVQRLWDDVVQLAADRETHPTATHFIGSLVLAPSPLLSPAGVATYLVVDGQQRLTTLTLLLAAIRDHRAQHEDPSHTERINDQFLINRWEQGQPLKLLPTQTDRDSYSACIRGTSLGAGDDNVGATYRFFKAQLIAFDDPDDPLDIDRIEDAVVNGLTLVAVTAQAGDNVHRIFESLNNTGLQLTQGDLLRNYYFMRLLDRSEVIYESVWRPLQERLDSDEIELLFWIDLVQGDPTAKQNDTYSLQQERLEHLAQPDDVESDLIRIGRMGTILERVLRPENEPNAELRTRLIRLRQWKTTTVVPVLVALLRRLDENPDFLPAVLNSLLYIESFLVRRVLFGRAQVNLNRILLGAVREVLDAESVDSALRTYLSTGRKYWATDEQIRSAVHTVPFYWSGRANQKRLILTWLDEALGSKEGADYKRLTIEHLIPQTLTDEWRDALLAEVPDLEEMEAKYEEVVQTLGNLTLTGYNSEMSNKPWSWKRENLKKSSLLMNHEIAENPNWGFENVSARASALAEVAIDLWPGPDPNAVGDEIDARWKLMDQLLAEIPPGRWTSYGDIASVIGTYAMPVGNRLATYPSDNAHRVLKSNGKVSSEFRWIEPDRDDDPRILLEIEGIVFDSEGRASQQQRLSAEALAELLGLPLDDDEEAREE